MLWGFYGGIRNLCAAGIEENCERVEERLKEYLATYPKSPTPIVITGNFLVSKAWQMRARDSATSLIDPFALRASKALFAQAQEFLLQHKEVGQLDPEWYTLMIDSPKRLDQPVAEIDAWMEEGVRRHPWYHPIVFAGMFAHFHVVAANGEQWLDDGGLERYARRAMSLVAPEDRSIIYSRLYWYAEHVNYKVQIFASSRVRLA